MIDLKTIDERLAKAKEDVVFWETARALLLDPRMQGVETNPNVLTLRAPNEAGSRPYGELKRRVLEVLPPPDGHGMTTAEIAHEMQRGGYVFASKVPAIAVNEALSSLGEQAAVAGKRGLAKLWTKGEPKNQEAPEGAS